MAHILKKIALHTISGANIATILVMLLTGYSGRLNPEIHPLLANIGLAFPVVLLINFAFLIVWAIIKPRGMLIPVVGYILCYAPIRTYIPLNITRQPPADAIKVMSYNVWLFQQETSDNDTESPMRAYLKNHTADILCLQEAMAANGDPQKIIAMLDSIYSYHTTDTMSSGEALALYTKYPIINKERIYDKEDHSLTVAVKLKIDNDTVTVINTHLETTNLTQSQRSQFKSLVSGELPRDTAQAESKMLFEKLAASSKKRAPQAKAIAKYIEQHKEKSIICCGDFNDSPISYSYHTIASLLTDCYREAGNGMGISYNRSAFYVRIDHILCSKGWKVYKTTVDKSIRSSDHYPIVTWIKKKGKLKNN